MSRAAGRKPAVFDRDTVLGSLGGLRGMIDVSLPTIAFVVANGFGGLTVGIWAALGTAVLVFALRLLRRESLQQAFSGLIGVAIAVALARVSGQARDFFVVGLIRNAGLGVVLVGSTLVRWPLVGVAAEFLAPSHLGSLAGHTVAGLFRSRDRARVAGSGAGPDQRVAGAGPEGEPTPEREPDPAPERPWRTDRRVVRVYTWLTLLWAATFLLRTAVQGFLYWRDEVALLGTSSVVLGLPVSGAALVVTLWAVARLHRDRAA